MDTRRVELIKRSGLLLLIVLLLSATATAHGDERGWWGWILDGWKPGHGSWFRSIFDSGSSDSSQINPTNVSVIDTDLQFSTLQEQPAAGQIEAGKAHETATGRGVVVAVLDGGFDLTHPRLAGHLSKLAYDAIDRDSDPTDLGDGWDDDRDGVTDRAAGHGNFVAGMVLMAAPDATILPIRVVDDEGFGTECELARGLVYAIDAGVDVINLSLETGAHRNWRVRYQLDRAWDMGIVVVVSAGNEGSDDLEYLADSGKTVTVGAVDPNDAVASFSNVPRGGAGLDVFAPGVDLWGPLTDGDMGFWSGTSFAAGIVSGAAALALEVDPTATPKDVRKILRKATDPVEGFQSTGRINLAKVVSR